jgi:phosphatidylserine/phosphatidylglycerophosphate/cardiolipin synthase-like enzyme
VILSKWLGRVAEPPQSAARGIVLTIPPQFRLAWKGGGLGTYEAIAGLLGEAAATVRVFSPYVDPTFTALLMRVGPRVPVKIVTTARDGRSVRPNPVLERCATDRALEVRYVVEHRHKAQMFQMHAKLVCVDARAAYVGSANLTDTSIHYNLELGLLTREPVEVAALESLFSFVWESLAVPARRL